MTGTLAGQLSGKVHVGISVGDFGSWMASEQRRIFLLCRRMLQDADEADSATQDVFLKAYRSILKAPADAAELDHPDKWLTRIAVNTCLDRLRSQAWKLWRRRPSAEDEKLILDMEVDSHPDAERQLLAKQIQARLEEALGKLTARQRAVFTLRHFDSMALDDIAEVLNLDTGTVKAHLFRALGKLRNQLNDLYLPPQAKEGSSRPSFMPDSSRRTS